MELDNNIIGEQPAQDSPELETDTGLEPKKSYGLRDGELFEFEDSSTEEQPKESESTEQPQVKTYKVKYGEEEIEVPETELVQGYLRQSDYTRKAQELAQERDRLRLELEQLRKGTPTPAPEPTPQPQGEVKASKIIENLVSRATEAAMRTLEITDAEEFDHWNPVHKAAYDLAMNNLVNSFREQESRIQTVRSFEAKLSSSDPEYNEIRQFATENLKYLPQLEYEKYQAGFASGDVAVIEDLYLKMKKAYNIYHGKETIEAKEQPTLPVQARAKTIPPLVESARGVAPAAEKPARDYSVLRGMTFDQQIKQMQEWGIKV